MSLSSELTVSGITRGHSLQLIMVPVLLEQDYVSVPTDRPFSLTVEFDNNIVSRLRYPGNSD